ncbi:5-(carboxyamino)imidazole ribonucleotide synthase [Pseudoroseicyclus sp. CXY001]|uniref:5-(carboxyamino)imidazole ribonucleotide synthase n=1 Tax=Pseudoroseicyclus sp. CXY001 TaxID=3242492 RepID=UPI0035716146
MTEPARRIGILGGGQLGRMLAMAAGKIGLAPAVLDPAGDAPAGQVAPLTAARWDDAEALARFARSVDVVTYEFENIPEAALDAIEAIVPIHPPRRALAVSQDRLVEKDFLSGLGLTTAPYAKVDHEEELSLALATIGTPAILKTRRLGYDGKGQARIMSPGDAEAALAAMAGAPAVLEGFVDFSAEISVIAARGQDGQVAAFDPGENRHEDGILRTTRVPATIPATLAADAVLLAGRILNALDYVGVLGVELFVTPGRLVVNEIAPRVHNSGHWTQAGCLVDQFEQHIRAVAGLPLGDGARHSDVEMENLIGEDVAKVPRLLAEGADLHLYGKAETRPGRKMGHVNRLIRYP